MLNRRLLLLALLLTAGAAHAEEALPAPQAATALPLTLESINSAEPSAAVPDVPSPFVVRLQVLLDRGGASPGVIDGFAGENLSKAVVAYKAIQGLQGDGVIDPAVWTDLLGTGEPAMVTYTITAEDTAGPFLGRVPTDYGEMAKLDHLGYANVGELLSEKFHLDPDLLHALNPGADYAAGSTIVVPDVAARSIVPVARLVADKEMAQLRGYDADGKLVVSYPATIGSTDMPSPSGTHSVKAIAPAPDYYYRPDVNFRQGDNTHPLTIPAGPNNPVGTTWIDLDAPTYGIHGTPEPTKIDKVNSHGCVRLTNWDVEELAGLIEPGIPVEFR